MKNKFLQEILVSVVLMILLVLLLNPFHFWMPTLLLMSMLISLVVAFSIFATFIWREKTIDEREDFHKMVASRLAFLFGAGMLVIGIIFECFTHQLDFWLVITLGVMILAKIIGRMYSSIKF